MNQFELFELFAQPPLTRQHELLHEAERDRLVARVARRASSGNPPLAWALAFHRRLHAEEAAGPGEAPTGGTLPAADQLLSSAPLSSRSIR